MPDSNRREHIRTAMNARVKLVHDQLGEFVFDTRDISDGGVFVVVGEQSFAPAIGDRVTVQVQGLPIPAPVLNMIVVRKAPEGFGLQFKHDAD